MTYQPPKVTPISGWRRPRGVRRTPSRRQRAPSDPYGQAHRQIRAMLMAMLAAAGELPCPLCGQPMYAAMGRALHLHHSNPQAKLAGLPGDQLCHAKCNVRDGGKLGAAITNGQATSKPTQRATVRQSREW